MCKPDFHEIAKNIYDRGELEEALADLWQDGYEHGLSDGENLRHLQNYIYEDIK